MQSIATIQIFLEARVKKSESNYVFWTRETYGETAEAEMVLKFTQQATQEETKHLLFSGKLHYYYDQQLLTILSRHRYGMLKSDYAKVKKKLEDFLAQLGKNGWDTLEISRLVDNLERWLIGPHDGVNSILVLDEKVRKVEQSRQLEVIMGDKFSNVGSGATIVNRSIVQNAFNKVKSEYDEETARALQCIEEEINKSGNQAAAATFNAFNQELQKPESQKPVLQALWQGVVTALPSIGQLAEVVEKIAKLFI